MFMNVSIDSYSRGWNKQPGSDPEFLCRTSATFPGGIHPAGKNLFHVALFQRAITGTPFKLMSTSEPESLSARTCFLQKIHFAKQKQQNNFFQWNSASDFSRSGPDAPEITISSSKVKWSSAAVSSRGSMLSYNLPSEATEIMPFFWDETTKVSVFFWHNPMQPCVWDPHWPEGSGYWKPEEYSRLPLFIANNNNRPIVKRTVLKKSDWIKSRGYISIHHFTCIV